MFNPFIKYRGFEFFGTYEAVSGKTIAETDNRKSTQMAVDLIYRFLANEQAYVGVRYNTLKSRLSGYTADVSVDRTAIAAGWFPTKNLLLKGEYVIQNYNDYKTTDILNGGKFNGIVIQAVVGF